MHHASFAYKKINRGLKTMFDLAKRIINYIKFNPKKNKSFTFNEASEGFSPQQEKDALKEAITYKLINKIELTEEEMEYAHKLIHRTNLEQGVYRLDPSFMEDTAFSITTKTVVYDKDTGDVLEIYYELKDIFSEKDKQNTLLIPSSTANHYLRRVPSPSNQEQP